MIKTIIKTCSCFLDIAVLFMDHDTLFCSDKYTSNCLKIRKRKEIFILDSRVDRCPCKNSIHNVIASSCVKCVKTQIVLDILGLETLTNVKCRNVTEDMTTFGSGFNEEVFIGNHPNALYEMNDESENECAEEVVFPSKPPRKS